jgi:hypothetical protein
MTSLAVLQVLVLPHLRASVAAEFDMSSFSHSDLLSGSGGQARPGITTPGPGRFAVPSLVDARFGE